MTTDEQNAAAAAAHIRTVVGPTILLGDGSYFDYDAPEATRMTIEDYAWGLAASGRFRGQTRLKSGKRCLYSVLNHVVIMTRQMMHDGCPREDCYAGLMHESDEVVFPDIPGPIKSRHRNLKADLMLWGQAIDERFGVTCPHPDLIKRYDIRMLATEKLSLMSQADDDDWPVLEGYEPFGFTIVPSETDDLVRQFINLYELLRP